MKAWTIGAANSWTLNIEFIGRAAQPDSRVGGKRRSRPAPGGSRTGHSSTTSRSSTACRSVHGQCVCTTPGVLRHSDVTAAGFGTHTDPGPQFPMDDFLDKGRWYEKHGWTT
jgi:hypothetical protein